MTNTTINPWTMMVHFKNTSIERGTLRERNIEGEGEQRILYTFHNCYNDENVELYNFDKYDKTVSVFDLRQNSKN